MMMCAAVWRPRFVCTPWPRSFDLSGDDIQNNSSVHINMLVHSLSIHSLLHYIPSIQVRTYKVRTRLFRSFSWAASPASGAYHGTLGRSAKRNENKIALLLLANCCCALSALSGLIASCAGTRWCSFFWVFIRDVLAYLSAWVCVVCTRYIFLYFVFCFILLAVAFERQGAWPDYLKYARS